MTSIQFEKIIPANEIEGEDEEDKSLILKSLTDARKYITSMKWCAGIKEEYLGLGIGGVVSIFLFHIEPNSSEVDEFVWVIVGDLPPAYITCEKAPNPACALDGYIGAMEEWVKAVNGGNPVDDLIPVNVPPTKEYADLLDKRLNFLDTEILSNYQDDLKY